jgi:hypothetical protein
MGEYYINIIRCIWILDSITYEIYAGFFLKLPYITQLELLLLHSRSINSSKQEGKESSNTCLLKTLCYQNRDQNEKRETQIFTWKPLREKPRTHEGVFSL